MKQAPGFLICHAPRYQSRLTIADRVQVFDGDRWRPLSASESTAPSANAVSVIAIPKHLLKRWWKLAESSDRELSNLSAGFQRYAREVAEYFSYKDWALPPDAVMEVVASDGQRDSAMQPSEVTRFSRGFGRLLACVNLDDQNLSIALGRDSARIRVILEPGVGVMIPASGILWSRSAPGASNPSVTLLIGSLSPE